MARFTQKAKENLYTAFDYEIVSEVPNDEEDMRQYAINKLGILENIEEELGIDLTTLLKALKNGVYCEKCEDRTKMEISYSEYFECFVFEDYNSHIHKLSAYGKTWALTKGEIENDEWVVCVDEYKKESEL